MRILNPQITVFEDSNLIKEAILADNVEQYDWVILNNGIWIKCPAGHYPQGVVEDNLKGNIRLWGIMRYPNVEKGKFYYMDHNNPGKISTEQNGMPVAYATKDWQIYVLIQNQYEVNNLLPVKNLNSDVNVFDLVIQDYNTGIWYKCPPDVNPLGILQTPCYVRHYGLMYYPGVKQGKIYYQHTSEEGKISETGTRIIGYSPYDDFLLVGINVDFTNWLGPSAPPPALPNYWDFDNMDWKYKSSIYAADFDNKDYRYASSIYMINFDNKDFQYASSIYNTAFDNKDFIYISSHYINDFDQFDFKYESSIFLNTFENDIQEKEILIPLISQDYTNYFTKISGDDFTEISDSNFEDNKGFQAPDAISQYKHNTFNDGNCRIKMKIKVEYRDHLRVDLYCAWSDIGYNRIFIEAPLWKIYVYKDDILLAETTLYRYFTINSGIYDLFIDLYETTLCVIWAGKPLITVTNDELYTTGSFGFGKSVSSIYNNFIIGDFEVVRLE